MKILRLIVLIILIVAICNASHANEKIRSILILNSYHKGFPWTDNVVKGIESVLDRESKNINLTVEYMDTKTMGFGEEYRLKLFEFFSYKYQSHHFDLIISSDDNAFDFLREFHEKLFPGAPIAVCGVNNRNAPDLVDPGKFTGVLESTSLEETIALILDLHPQTKRIFLVIDKTPSGKYRWSVTQPSFGRYKQIAFIRLSDDYSINEVEDIVGGLKEDSVVIFFTLYRDNSGRYISLKEGVSRITNASARPVYTTHRLELPYGVVGGKVLGGFHHGETIANIGMRILNGEDVKNIPFLLKSPTQYIFDYNQLEKWDIQRSELPEESLILNKPFSAYDAYKFYIWAVITTIIMLVLIVFILQANFLKRKQAESALLESEKKYRDLIEMAQEGIWVIDAENNTSFVNPSMARMLGYTEPEMIGKKLFDFMDVQDIKTANQKIEKRKDGIAEQHDFEFIHKHGKRIYTTVETAPIVDENGDYSGAIAGVVNITDRKKAEAVLVQQKYFLQKAQEIGKIGTWELDSQNNKLFWTDENYKIFGIPVGTKLTYETFLNCVHPDDRAYVDTEWNAACTGKSYDISHRLIVNNETKWVREKAELIFNEKGEWVKATGVTQDITEQKKTAEILEKRNTDLKLAQRIASIGTWTLDPEIGVAEWSEEIYRIYERDPKLGPHPLSDYKMIYTGEYWERFNSAIQRAVKDGISYDIELKLELPSGHVRWVHAICEPDPVSGPKGRKLRGTIQDITEKKQTENALRQSQKMESIGTLAGGIAHEFNNILSIIIGNNELIMEDLPESSLSRENSEEIRLAGLRAGDIVKQLLTFSRYDVSTKKNIDIRSAVKESLKLIRSTMPANIEIRDAISPNCFPVLGDATQINQILINLCSNAADALPISGGRIDIELCNSDIEIDIGGLISTLPPGNYVKLQVRDNGIGMDKAILDRVFEPYFTTKEIGEGSGIGLAVVHGIVANHEGSIVCDSTKGQGTVFTILLPAYEGPVKEETDKKEILPGNGEKVLYVDDEFPIAKLVRHHLASIGYDAYSTTDPSEALKMIKEEPGRFDLVITDLAMPNMPGDLLINQILEIRPDIPTIICTGYSSRISEKEAIKMGVKAFLMKPLNKADLSKTVKQVLEGINQIRE